jgi:cytoskeletal protein CcmA (bactofilin family)
MVDRLGASGGEKTTLVEDGTEFKGSFTSKCPIVVRGRIEGDVAAPSLTVSPTGSVQGKAKVGQLHSEGEIAGDFDADVIELSGKVKDNTVIRARSLNIKLSPDKGKMQVVFGECTLEVGDDPAHKDTGATRASAAPVASDEFGPILARGTKASADRGADPSRPSSTPPEPANGGK